MTARPPADASEPRVLLLGMMGSGKTTVGRALSTATGWPYLDNDELVRRATGEPTPDVLGEEGEVALRAAESAALTEALTVATPVIAAVAGGIVGDDADLARLREGGFVVYLRARIDTLVDRVGSGEGRPWLQPNPRQALEKLYAGREERYREAATCIVDVDDRAPARIAELIVAALG
jgi:shikimate kinase